MHQRLAGCSLCKKLSYFWLKSIFLLDLWCYNFSSFCQYSIKKAKKELKLNKKIFDPGKYGMEICPCCNSNGFIQNPKRQCCPNCGGFGFIKKVMEQEKNSDWKSNLQMRNVLVRSVNASSRSFCLLRLEIYTIRSMLSVVTFRKKLIPTHFSCTG